MTLFLTIFTLFDLCAALAAIGAVRQLSRPEARGRWASARLFHIARAAAWGLLALAPLSALTAWLTAPHGAPVALLPILWILISALVFAIVDFAEDGVFDFGRGPPKSP